MLFDIAKPVRTTKRTNLGGKNVYQEIQHITPDYDQKILENSFVRHRARPNGQAGFVPEVVR